MRTRVLVYACCAALAVLGLTSPVAAETGDMQLRFGLLYSSPTDDYTAGGLTAELDSALGFLVGFEYHVTDMIGIEPTLSSTSFDLTSREAGFPDENGDTDLMALAVNVNFHFERDSGLDLFVGPTVGYAFWGDINLDDFPDAIPTDSEFLYGVNGGMDYPMGDSNWSFNAGLSYIFVDLTPEGSPVSIGVSPFQLRVGVTYNF